MVWVRLDLTLSPDRVAEAKMRVSSHCNSRSNPFKNLFNSFLASLISPLILPTSSSSCSTPLPLLALSLLLAFNNPTLSFLLLTLSVIPSILSQSLSLSPLSTDSLPPYSLTHTPPPQSSPTHPPPRSNPIPVPLYSPISASFSPHTPPSFLHSSAPPTSP